MSVAWMFYMGLWRVLFLDELTARAMAWTRTNWQRVFSYAEVICFVSAWAMSLLLALSAERSADDHSATRSIAVTTDVLGIQATRSQ
jgi:hypothetical protein